jgi:tetrahydromethanopterin S-methyltransferase subunit G
MIKHHDDIDKLREKHNNLALSLPKEYVSKEDFKMFSERMNDRFDRLEEKIDSLNK